MSKEFVIIADARTIRVKLDFNYPNMEEIPDERVEDVIHEELTEAQKRTVKNLMTGFYISVDELGKIKVTC